MKPENLKLLFDSYIQCKQNQQECHGPGNLADEYDYPVRLHSFGGEYTPLHATGYAYGVEPSAECFLSECDGPRNLTVGWDGMILNQLEGISHDERVEPFFETLPHVLLSEQAPPNLPENVTQAGSALAQMAQEFSTALPDKSIIQFKDICMVVEPVEQTISILVMRDPNFSQTITKVYWKTCDKTALTGTHYVGTSGELIFNEGETSKDIKIKILNSDDSKTDDLRFTVELNYDGVFNPNPMTVSLEKINTFCSDEMAVLRNLPCSLPFAISDIKSTLEKGLTCRTFHTALTHLCSTNKATDVQIALAFELSSSFLCKLGGDTILSILTDFFRMDNFDF